MKRLLIMASAALVLSACDEKPGIDGMQATPQGVYYRNIWGRLFRVEGDKLVLIREPEKQSTRSLTFSQSIPSSDTGAGFPAKADGTLKLEHDVQKLRLSLSLVPVGQRMPTVDDQEKFANALIDGTSPLKAITLQFYDKDGYVAGAARTISPGEAGWSRNSDDNGHVHSSTWLTRDPLDPEQAAEIASVSVLWSSVSPPATPPPAQPAPFPSQASPPAFAAPTPSDQPNEDVTPPQ